MTNEELANKLGNDLSEINPGSDQIDLILAYADEIRRECAGELQLLDKQRKEVHALVHKRPAPAGIVSMLCNMTERHTIELAKLSRAAIMGKDAGE